MPPRRRLRCNMQHHLQQHFLQRQIYYRHATIPAASSSAATPQQAATGPLARGFGLRPLLPEPHAWSTRLPAVAGLCAKRSTRATALLRAAAAGGPALARWPHSRRGRSTTPSATAVPYLPHLSTFYSPRGVCTTQSYKRIDVRQRALRSSPQRPEHPAAGA